MVRIWLTWTSIFYDRAPHPDQLRLKTPLRSSIHSLKEYSVGFSSETINPLFPALRPSPLSTVFTKNATAVQGEISGRGGGYEKPLSLNQSRCLSAPKVIIVASAAPRLIPPLEPPRRSPDVDKFRPLCAEGISDEDQENPEEKAER
jgi:hypothetical protein